MNRLTRIKTTYNQGGKYDEQDYFQQQKIVYDREIQFANKVSAITEDQFALKPLEIGFMQSSALKDEQKFKEIKKILTQYNKSVIEFGGKSVNGLHLKTVVMQSMLKFMRLMMLAPDTTTKKLILDIAHHWFMRHLDPKMMRKSTNQLLKQIKNILVKKELLPIDIINKELILTKVQQNLRPYKIKARTMHKQLDDPDIELKNYHTHKLEFLSAQPINNAREENKKWIDTVKFPKIEPPGYYFQVEEPEKPQQLFPPEQEKKQVSADPQQNAQQTNLVKPSIDGQPPIEGQKPIQDENQVIQDLDFGAGDNQPEQEEPVEEQVQKQKGKLDPLLKVFLLERIRDKQKQQIRADRKYEHKYNKINRTQMEDYDQVNYMRNWAGQKSRLKTELNRKHQSMKGVEKISRGRGQSTRGYLENEMEKLKIQRVLGHYQKNITQIEKPSEPLNCEAGLSLFDRRRVKTEASQKPFSTILQDNNKKIMRTQTVQQIGNLKQRLAKYRLYTPVDTLAKGLLQPLQKDDDLIQEYDGKVIWPNSQMLSNPFFKVGKKKKKKKKKKK